MVLNSWQWRLFFLALTLLLGSFATGHLLEISDLGRGTSIGALYDVVTGEILDVALWSNNVTNSSDLVRTIPAHYARLSFTRSERTEDRASLQSLSGEVTGSILGGFLSVKGSALVLEHKRRSRSTAEVVANYHIETRKTVINAYDPRLCKEQLQVGEFPGLKRATHVVTGILYGGDCAAIFSTESASRFDKSADLTKIEGEIDFWLGSYTQTLVERDDIKESSSASSSITVEIFGDLLPEGPLPGDVESAVRFMSAMPQQMVSQGDLPKRLFLTPLSELPCDEQAGRRLERATLQHYFELPDRFVTLSIRLLEELDTAEQCLNELSLRPHRGFISLRQAIHCHLENLQDYRKQFRQQLKESTQAFRNDGAEQKLDYLVQSFYESGYSLQETQSLCNKLQTKWSTADDVADFMEQSNLQMGNHISDFIGPSLNPRVHSAYQFLFVGEPDSVENRESVKLLKDFAHLAGQRKRVSGSSCDDCEPVSFSAIQFDSFCLQFCRPEQCQLWCKNCGEGTDLSNSTASSDLVFLMPQQESWCEVPQSRVLLSVRNAQPQVVNVQHIQPPSSLDLLEVRYNGHEIELILGNQSSCAPPVLRHVLRVSWETKEDSMHLYSQHRDFEIYAPEDAARIVLDAGRVYSFQVAAVNQVGIGPFSSKRRAMATSTSSERRLAAFAGLFGLPVPVVGLLASREAVLSLPETKRNRVPSWRCVQVTISLSSDTQEEISGVRFSDAENVHQNLTCAARMSSYNEIHCTIPTRKTSVDILWNVEVLGFDRPIAELGHLLQEAPSVQACREWSQADYCHSIEPTCVKTCADCAARPHAHAPPNCSSVDAGHYWSELTGVPVNGNRQDEADFELENGEVCPLEPEPYWKEDASFRRLTPTHRPAPASLVLDIRLWRSEVAASCQATSQVAPDKCSRQVVRAVPSPIQQLRDQLNSSVLLIMEAWLMVPEATVFSKDPETLCGAQLLQIHEVSCPKYRMR
ncbi:unnamed protein product [Durusdinium trenchii]|uniref:Fibronectin type-III domain-containing protein n=1 Tax=Durusdinium trenchii TaxID=1381693 RepID=A0ABP0H6F2_9DINO